MEQKHIHQHFISFALCSGDQHMMAVVGVFLGGDGVDWEYL